MEDVYSLSCSIGQKNGGDLQKIITKFIPTFPWSRYSGEHHMVGHSFTGYRVA
jgi:hypothetical protein